MYKISLYAYLKIKVAMDKRYLLYLMICSLFPQQSDVFVFPQIDIGH